MEYRFNADEWAKLSHGERVHRCRLMANEARRLAEQAAPELKRTYLQIAGDWEVLADQLGQEFQREFGSINSH